MRAGRSRWRARSAPTGARATVAPGSLRRWTNAGPERCARSTTRRATPATPIRTRDDPGPREPVGRATSSRTATVSTTWTACPDPRSHATERTPLPEVAPGPPVDHASMHIAEHPAGERRVEELRPVVGPDRLPQGHVDAEPARDQAPPPRTAQRGQHRDREGGRERPRGRQPQPVHERARADPPDEDGEDRGAARRGAPRSRMRRLMAVPPIPGRAHGQSYGGNPRMVHSPARRLRSARPRAREPSAASRPGSSAATGRPRGAARARAGSVEPTAAAPRARACGSSGGTSRPGGLPSAA